MIDRLASQTLAAWYNRLMERETWARAALQPYAGRSACIEAGLASIRLAIASDGSLLAEAGEDAAPSVTLRLAAQAIAGALLDPATFLNPAAAAERLRAQVHIEGDAAFAQALTDVLTRLRPDPAEDLARVIGDAPAQRLVTTFTATLDVLRDAAARLARQGADFVVAEQPLVVGSQEFAGFRDGVAALAARVMALEARVEARGGAPGPVRP